MFWEWERESYVEIRVKLHKFRSLRVPLENKKYIRSVLKPLYKMHIFNTS